MYKGMYKAEEKALYNDAIARIVQDVQDTQEVFDNSLSNYARKNAFAQRYSEKRNKRAVWGLEC